MNSPFPFGFPAATAWYLSLYALTLALHVVFMNYTLVASGWLAISALRMGSKLPRPEDRPRTATSILVDWLPAMLSGAITAGIAPLLFLQILYQQPFYTANLLLFRRWMAILPVLIVAFYSLYLLRGPWLRQRGSLATAMVGCVPLACIAFHGVSWTVNHLLSLKGPAYWAEFYVQWRLVYWEWSLLPRLLVWSSGAVATFAVVLSWQLVWHQSRGTLSRPPVQALSIAALTGMGVAALGALIYLLTGSAEVRTALASSMSVPYLAAAIVGLLLQTAAWVLMLRSDALARLWLSLASVGLVLTIVGTVVCREAIRVATLGAERMEALYERHASAGQVGGLAVFLAFLTINGLLIALCFWLVIGGKKGRSDLPDKKV